MRDPVAEVLLVLDRNLRSIWEGDVETYRATTADDVSFYEWYISPQRIDGLDFHLRELRVHNRVLSDAPADESRIEHELLQPRVQLYADTAIISYTLLLRTITPSGVSHKSHNETRVFHNMGTGDSPQWMLVHCHKSPVVTGESLRILRS